MSLSILAQEEHPPYFERRTRSLWAGWVDVGTHHCQSVVGAVGARPSHSHMFDVLVALLAAVLSLLRLCCAGCTRDKIDKGLLPLAVGSVASEEERKKLVDMKEAFEFSGLEETAMTDDKTQDPLLHCRV